MSPPEHDDGELPVWTLDRFDPEKMKLLALLMADPNPLHYDPEVAPRLGVAERPVNQGPSSIAMLANVLRSAWPDGQIERLQVQLRGSVIAGESVRAHGKVTARERERGEERVHCELILDVSGRGTVLTGTAEVMLPETNGATPDSDAEHQDHRILSPGAVDG